MAVVDLIPASWRLSMARSLIKGAALPIVSDFVRSSFIEPTWRVLIRDGVKANAAVYGCILALAIGFSEPPRKVYDLDGKPLPKHALQKLLRRPNSLMSEAEFSTYCIVWLAIGGNLYIHKVRSKAGKVIELWPYHAGHVTPIPGGPNWIKYYEYDPGTGVKIRIEPEDMIHMKWPLPDPEQPWMATPPLLHAAREVDTDNEATKYLFSLLKNDALPRTVIEMPADSSLSPDQFKRLKQQFNERYGGDKRGSVGLLEGGAKLNRIALNMQELAFESLRRVPEARIAMAFRVPPVIAGLNVGLEFGNDRASFEGALFQFTSGILTTLWRLMESELSQSLGMEFGDEIEIKHDLSMVRALQENENDKWKRLDMAVRGGWVTPNEARSKVGFDPVEGGDVLQAPRSPFGEGGVSPDAGKSAAEEVAEKLIREWARPQTVIMMPGEKSNGNGHHIEKLSPFGLKSIASKAARLEAAQRIGETLQALRSTKATLMEPQIDEYFDQLSERVVSRAMNWEKAVPALSGGNRQIKKLPAGVEAKGDLPPLSSLLEPKDDDELEALVKRFYADLLHVSWGVWDYALGEVVMFDQSDPIVSEILGDAGKHIRQISATTRDEVRDLLKHGNDNGWSIEQLVRGDPDADPPVAGLKDLVTQTYKGRAKAIARTELGTAQQTAATGRYERAGVKDVLVLDNGFDNSDPVCKQVAGTIKSLEWAKQNPLQHPNCVRAFAPHFED